MVHVLKPAPTDIQISHHPCPTCQRKRPMIGFFTPWYGWETVCLQCGERWQDAERLPRPFYPRWRQDSIARAKRRYRQLAPRLPTDPPAPDR